MRKGIYLRDGGASAMVLIALVWVASHFLYMATGGDKKQGDTVTVRPASEEKK